MVVSFFTFEFYYHLLDIRMYDTSGIKAFFKSFSCSLTHSKSKQLNTHHPSPITCSWRGSCSCFFSAQIAPRQKMRWCHYCEWRVSSLWSMIIYQPQVSISVDRTFPIIPTNLIWLLLAGDLWVSKREGLFCFLFTGSEEENQSKSSHKWTLQ